MQVIGVIVGATMLIVIPAKAGISFFYVADAA